MKYLTYRNRILERLNFSYTSRLIMYRYSKSSERATYQNSVRDLNAGICTSSADRDLDPRRYICIKLYQEYHACELKELPSTVINGNRQSKLARPVS